MDLKAYYSELLSKMLFLHINKEKTKDLFKLDISEDIYIPVSTDDLANEAKKSKDNLLNTIPVSLFVEGMYYVLGADEHFKYNDYYKKMILNIKDSKNYIKSIIGKNVRKNLYEKAYIELKGLCSIEVNKDNLSKLLFLCDKLRTTSNGMYDDEEIDLIEKSKEFDEDFAEPYLYECLFYRDENDFDKAFYCLNVYLSKGGENTKEITELRQSLKLINEYDKAKSIVNEEPDTALKILLPLMDVLGDSAEYYYYIAVAYRNLGNNEKAIFYLNDALAIDDKAVEIINEAGLNYACIGDYEKAISYFRTAFSYTGSVEICTNLVMCYLNIKDLKQAKIHLKMAEEIDPNDEVVKDLKKYFN